MAVSTAKKRLKKERAAINFDIICGATSSIKALSAIIFVVVVKGIYSLGWFIAGLTFWMVYLAFSLFLIGLGIHTWYKEKNFDKMEQRKDLKAPIV